MVIIVVTAEAATDVATVVVEVVLMANGNGNATRHQHFSGSAKAAKAPPPNLRCALSFAHLFCCMEHIPSSVLQFVAVPTPRILLPLDCFPFWYWDTYDSIHARLRRGPESVGTVTMNRQRQNHS